MIICAAIKIQMNNLPEPTIIPCWRHGYGYSILRDLVPDRFSFKVIEEGFINHHGAFLNRAKAYREAKTCGQINSHNTWYRKDNKVPNELYSEDLY